MANVAAETNTGDGGLRIRSGLRRFGPGARLWVLRTGFDDSYRRVNVVGRHRGPGHRLIHIIIELRGLTNFRVRPVHSPAVYIALTRPWEPSGNRRFGALWDGPEQAQEYAHRWNRPRLQVRFDNVDGGTVADPPPLELERGDKIYYLAHFNSRFARYSSLPPPKEPPWP
ncbi:hypothetical protein GCM10010109_58830 [Actinoplanes campanulatus]|nr:hypothetical protein GCM10010109_58830 [Actinoplanes campanulatus]GID39107.1 hypothetical protein Aca09nite_56130 [Actinoplanes campanulatus]